MVRMSAIMSELSDPETGVPAWREELRVFLELVQRPGIAVQHDREDYGRTLARTLDEQVYPAFEEFLSEMSRHGVDGQLYGRGTGWAITLAFDDGFEVAVERDRHREQSHLLPRLIFVNYMEKDGRRYLITDGVAWDRIGRAEAVSRVLEEYKRWRLLSLLSRI
jgi:hypothetical protein